MSSILTQEGSLDMAFLGVEMEIDVSKLIPPSILFGF